MNQNNRLKEIIDVIKSHDLLKNRSVSNIRETIEDLGPTFIKMGQILSLRPDLISEDLSNELKKLRCSVKPMDSSIVKEILDAEFDSFDEVFSSFDFEPIGSASIGQTHKAVLVDGSVVAVKIQRKGIEDMMLMDTKLIHKALSILHFEKLIGNTVDIHGVVDEIYNSAKEEMDFNIEASHIDEFFNNNKDILYLKPLKVYKEFSTHRVLVMEFVSGNFISDVSSLNKLGYDMSEISLKLADNYIKQALDDGFFHADPHSDNIKIFDGKIVYLDFGMMGRLSSNHRDLLNKCILGIISNDVQMVSRVLVLLDTNHNEIDYMRLNNDLRIILDKYKTTDIANIDIKAFFYEMFSMLSKNGINLPKNISMLFRGIIVLEGVLEEINPDINLMSVLKNRVKGTGFNKDVFEGLVLDGIKSGTSLVSIPNEILTFFKGVNTGELRFNIEMNDSKNQVNQILDIFHQGIIAILDVAFIIGISLIVFNDHEFSITYFLYVMCACIFTAWLFLKMIKNKLKK